MPHVSDTLDLLVDRFQSVVRPVAEGGCRYKAVGPFMMNKVSVCLEVCPYTVQPCFVQLLSQLFVCVLRCLVGHFLENVQHQVAFSRPDRHGSGSHLSLSKLRNTWKRHSCNVTCGKACCRAMCSVMSLSVRMMPLFVHDGLFDLKMASILSTTTRCSDETRRAATISLYPLPSDTRNTYSGMRRFVSLCVASTNNISGNDAYALCIAVSW